MSVPPIPDIEYKPSTGKELLDQLALRAEIAGLAIECPPSGSFNATVAIVAEAPGEREVASKVPLSGGAGNMLWQHLRKYGIDRSNCWVTNVCKRQVSLSRETDDRHVVPRGETEHWEGLLRWELASLPNLRYVLVLGSPALAALSDHQGIDKWRGTVEQRDGRWYVYAFNPANVLRKSSLETVFALDIWKLDAVMRGKYKPHDITAHVCPSPDEALRWIEKMRDERLPIAFDIETAGDETACIGFANNAHEGMCISFRTEQGHAFSTSDEVSVRRAIADMLQESSIRLVAQNASFDVGWLGYKDHIRVPKVWFDTLLAHHTLYPLQPHNLGFLTSQYTWHPYYKDEKTAWRELGQRDIERFWRYNVTDVCITHACHTRLHAELVQQEMDKFFFSHVMALQPHLVRMTLDGVLCDLPLKEEIIRATNDKCTTLLSTFHHAVHEATGDDTYNPNPNSPAQLKALFFNRLRLVGKGLSTDEENRKRMMLHPGTPEKARIVLRTLGEFKKEDKFRSTYAESRPDEDGRFRCEYKQYGTTQAPGRLSSSATLWGSGGNMQNQPERAKEMFIADDNYVFVYFDLSQAESRYVGWDAGIPMWIEQYERARLEGSGYDAHRALASEMFKVPYDQVPKKDHDENGNFTIRYKAKRCRHGLNYRMGPEELATQLGCSTNEAIALWNIYHRTTPQLRSYWQRLEREVRDTRRLYNSYGRRLLFQGRIDDESMKSIVAFRPQSTIGDHVAATIRLCQEDSEWPIHSARMLVNVHDALIALAHKSVAQRVASIMVKHAQRPVPIRGQFMVIPAEIAISMPQTSVLGQSRRRWSSLQKVQSLDDISKIVSQN